MASSSLQNSKLRIRRPLSFLFILFLYTSLFMFTFLQAQPQKKTSLGRRILSTEKEEEQQQQQPKNKTSLEKNKNQTKPIKPIKTTSNSTTKVTLVNINQSQPITNSTTTKPTLSKIQLKNLTSTSNSSNPIKPKSISINKSPDLLKSINTPKNKTTSTKQPQLKTKTNEKLDHLETSKKPKTTPDNQPKDQNIKDKSKIKHPTFPYTDPEEEEDFIAEFRDLPYKFHNALLPDLEKISTTSKAYISKANQEITQGFKPLVGNKYASIIASLTSCIFLLLPLLLVSLLFNQIKTYISLQKILIFIQIYLAIYFLILSLAYFATGLEPLRFFYATSASSYVTMQVLQTLGYVLYLLLQLLHLVMVFSTMESGVGLKVLGLAQMVVGLAVGLHYYAAVFHRAVVGKPPKSNWKIHGIYATCFLLICLSARAERRKKTYLQVDGEDDCKKS